MHFSHLPVMTRAVLALVTLYIAYSLYCRVSLYLLHRALARSRGAFLSPPNAPQKDFILGLDRFMERRKSFKEHRLLEDSRARFAKRNVNTLNVVILGHSVYVTIEPENLKVIQAVDFKKWGLGERRKVGFRPFLGDGIFTTDGAQWAHSREMLRPNFVRSQVADLDSFEHHVSRLLAAIPKDGATVDLSDLFFRLTMDSATDFLFGESTESLTKDDDDGFAGAFNRSQEFIGHGGSWGLLSAWFPWLFPENEFKRDRDFVHSFVDYYVDKGLAKRDKLIAEHSNADKSGRYVFIDELVRQTTDRVRIRSELLNILLAGRDTTASLLTNLWFTLSKRPDLWAKLQAEVSRLDGALPTFEELKDLKYLRALMNESLRLHPVVPQNSREALEDTFLPLGGGPDAKSPLFVPKGMTVAWSVYGMHRRQDYYGADSEEFKPERWLDDPKTGKKGLRTGWEYLPFNGGARICLGQQYALTEASYATVRLCQTFKGIESRDPTEQWTESMTLTCINLTGAKVALTPRE